ncbi:XdhC family protein [Flavivirga aquimarina]|uniref:XdhC family protein n=1 Tax=Flavivirga aquimarina TaxID=2027862 RepID=A0ABT8W6C9_9FLAO|nr:XdhC/CoxI family protein [Flavivirga aquimarina]MDO5968672.1 XdhC family protein [Flavivirga aquimarina]
MTHEFKNIVEDAFLCKNKGLKTVLASVVALDGSSYRKPGVRMLIKENGDMIGAVSGGCVEKEIQLQSETVFKTGISKVMTYDGRYRLGCEGVLYILLELFTPSEAFYKTFTKSIKERISFEIVSFFEKKPTSNANFGSLVKLNNEQFSVSNSVLKANKQLSVFKQSLPPCFKLVIIGAEHDAVTLCKYATLTGWETTIVSGSSESKSIKNFSGASGFYTVSPENMDVSNIDNQTAIVLMTHNFANDLRYLVQLKDTNPVYIGLLGPSKRRDDMLSQFIEYCPDADDAFLDTIHGPAGLNIGSETPQEIAISVISEILAFTRHQTPISLSKKAGKIHS